MSKHKKIKCLLCNDDVDALLYSFHFKNESWVFQKIKEEHPTWVQKNGMCKRCYDYYETQIIINKYPLPSVGFYYSIKTQDDYLVLPIALRTNANPHYTGKGSVICFVDSGFNFHPDYDDRILFAFDINKNEKLTAQNSNTNTWHGTMTTAVCAGNGKLSKGLYKGIANQSKLVLLKVMNEDGKISDDAIFKALQWVNKNSKKYGINIVNLSLGGDINYTMKESIIDLEIQKLYKKNILVVAASGNSEDAEIKPPANSIHTLTVGGYDDLNELNTNKKSYHSTYGITKDGYAKPDLLGPSIWVAAPIPTATKEFNFSLKLHEALEKETDEELEKFIAANKIEIENLTPLEDSRKGIIETIQKNKFINSYYMHVDGTSFAAPIISSIAAQIIECYPEIHVQNLKQILFESCERSEHISNNQQGYGIVNADAALRNLMNIKQSSIYNQSPTIDYKKKQITFFYHNYAANEVALSGNFNNWDENKFIFQFEKNGWWKIQIPILKAGEYEYKFFVNNKIWKEDSLNSYRVSDGMNGFNNFFEIK